MKPPKSYEALLSCLLLALGAVFTLVGLVGNALSIPVRNGDTQDFALFGLPLLVFGAGLLLWSRQRERGWERLRAEGQAVPGKLVPGAVRHHRYVSFGSDGLHKRSPWTVLCIYRWENRTYSVRSQFLWSPPREDGQPTIYIDPLHPTRAWIDPESLQYERT